MKLKEVLFYIVLIAGISTTFLACNRLNKSERIKTAEQKVILGTTVQEIDKRTTVVFQDVKNNYWFGGSNKGVYKYDGKKLTLFNVTDGLPDNNIIGIQEDKKGNIFFNTTDDVSKFDGQKFITLEVLDSNSSNNWKLEPDDIWFRMGVNKKGPYRYDGETLFALEFPRTNEADTFYAKYPNASWNPYGIYNFYRDREGSVWFGTASLGVCRYDGKSISWLYEKQLTETPNGGDFGIRSIIEDKDGYFWFCNTRYRYKILAVRKEIDGTSTIEYTKIDGVGKSNANNENPFPYFMSIVEDKNGDLWMATYNDGVWRNNGEKLFHYPILDGAIDVLIYSIYKDNQGNLWLGTHNAGVYKFNGTSFAKFKF